MQWNKVAQINLQDRLKKIEEQIQKLEVKLLEIVREGSVKDFQKIADTISDLKENKEKIQQAIKHFA